MLKIAARCEVAEECKRVHGITLGAKIGEAYERHCQEFLERSNVENNYHSMHQYFPATMKLENIFEKSTTVGISFNFSVNQVDGNEWFAFRLEHPTNATNYSEKIFLNGRI
jgi:hypothetical protein